MRKMSITSFKKETYLGSDIYVRSFNYHFEFLIVYKGKIHTAHLPMRPDFKNRMLYLLGRQELPYSEKQINACKLMMLQIAQNVIDELSSKK